MVATKTAGTWTYADLFSLPDDSKRYEIIEGELYEMPPPSAIHATIVFNLVLLLGPIVRSLGGRMLFAPLDVFFPGADPVQPDILALLPGWEGRITRRGAQGAPDLVIEVLSPSNRGHDLLTKRALYARAGVREYWIVDPEARTVDMLVRDRDAFHVVQSVLGAGDVLSSLLGGATFSVTGIFAGIDEIED